MDRRMRWVDGKLRYFLGGREVSRAKYNRSFRADRPGVKVKNYRAWPMRSEALAVHPKQVKSANDRNKRHGVNVTYDAGGLAHVPDRNEHGKILKLEGLHLNNSFNGY